MASWPQRAGFANRPGHSIERSSVPVNCPYRSAICTRLAAEKTVCYLYFEWLLREAQAIRMRMTQNLMLSLWGPYEAFVEKIALRNHPRPSAQLTSRLLYMRDGSRMPTVQGRWIRSSDSSPISRCTCLTLSPLSCFAAASPYFCDAGATVIQPVRRSCLPVGVTGVVN